MSLEKTHNPQRINICNPRYLVIGESLFVRSSAIYIVEPSGYLPAMIALAIGVSSSRWIALRIGLAP